MMMAGASFCRRLNALAADADKVHLQVPGGLHIPDSVSDIDDLAECTADECFWPRRPLHDVLLLNFTVGATQRSGAQW